MTEGRKPIEGDPKADLSRLTRQLTDLSPLPMAATEGSGRIVRYANPAFCRLLGKSCEEIVGRTLGEVVPTGQEFDAMQHEVYRSSAAETGLENTDSEMLPTYWSHVKWPILGPDERPVGIMVQVTDTRLFHQQATAMNESLMLSSIEQHELTEMEAKLNAQLQAEITERKRIEEDLKNADTRKDEFLAMLAHELRNPLAPLRNAVEVLNLVGPADPVVKQQRDLIDRQVSHMARLLDDLLDASRITRGNIKLRQQPVSLSAVAARAVESVQSLVQVRRQTLTVLQTEGDICILSDFDRLTQVVTNLVNNAVKYTPEEGQIWLVISLENDQVVLRVRDNGIGIAPDVLPHVFDLFTQADASFSRTRGGLGIGLTLVRTIVELHGGTVEAHSAGLGRGSEFIVRLPGPVSSARCSNIPTQAEETEQAHRPTFERRRVLVVDDVLESATSLAQIVQLWGHEVHVVYSAASALDAVRSFHPDFVLLDIGLPEMDGFEVARRIRQEHGQQIVLVAQTGYGQEQDQNRAQAAGFDHHLVKPLDLKRLKALISHGRDVPAGSSPA